MYNNGTTGKPKEDGAFWGTLFSPFTFPKKFEKDIRELNADIENLKIEHIKTRKIMHRQTEQAKVEIHQQTEQAKVEMRQQTEQAIIESHRITQESIEDLQRYAAKAPALRH